MKISRAIHLIRSLWDQQADKEWFPQEYFRCKSCGKLLAEVAGAGTVIKCTRCKLVNEVKQTAKDGRVEIAVCIDPEGTMVELTQVYLRK